MRDNVSLREGVQKSLRQAASNLLSLKMIRAENDPDVARLLEELRSAISGGFPVPGQEHGDNKHDRKNYRKVARDARKKSKAAKRSHYRHSLELALMQEIAAKARERVLQAQARHLNTVLTPAT